MAWYDNTEREMSKLTGKVAVVTGGSKGIGAEIARRLAADGAAVVVSYASDREGAAKVVADIEGAGGKAVAVQGNVGDPRMWTGSSPRRRALLERSISW